QTYVEHLYAIMSSLFRDELVPALQSEGIRFSEWSTLNDDDRLHLDQEFEAKVFPVLTPLAVDPAHPFPWISNLSLNLAVFVRDPRSDETLFARVKVPALLPRFVVLPDGERFVPIEQIIAAHLDRLFPGMEVVAHHAFRVTRNADLIVEEEEADDLLLAIQSELTRQRFGRVVRLEVEPTMTDSVLAMLAHELDVDPEHVYVVPAPLDLSGLFSLHELDRPELKYPEFRPVTPARIQGSSSERADLFAAIRRGEVLLHHPYEDFTTSVAAFIEQAARDPQVLAIKQTLYRTSGAGSPIVKSLVKAAERGKQVVALVELKARFDEQSNIERARVMEEAGVHVVYGVAGLKTHTKTALVVRREDDGRLRRYFHIGTGNYNDKTARVYEDLSILSCDPDLGADLSDLFNLLSGYSAQAEYRRLLVAPQTFRPRMVQMIRDEAAADDGHICAKMNSLVDPEIIQELYAASKAGTRIELIVRGTCTLRPGLPGLSENITVRSIVGRYLEHSRIYRFGSKRRGHHYWTGSGDWMTRNLDRRVEAITPVTDERLMDRLAEILEINLQDDTLAWELEPDGRWLRVAHTRGVETHVQLQRLARNRARVVE
ncbi:MAG: polyphosphate kinase, partial [Glaciecola sp.]